MIVPDVNLLLYAYSGQARFHEPARLWWESLLNGTERVGLPWSVVASFVRLMTNRSAVEVAITPSQALDFVDAWFMHSHVVTLNPSSRHLMILRRNLEAVGIGGNLVTDAHIAAVALEHHAEVHTNDRDFSRFPGLRWRNPLR